MNEIVVAASLAAMFTGGIGLGYSLAAQKWDGKQASLLVAFERTFKEQQAGFDKVLDRFQSRTLGEYHAVTQAPYVPVVQPVEEEVDDDYMEPSFARPEPVKRDGPLELV